MKFTATLWGIDSAFEISQQGLYRRFDAEDLFHSLMTEHLGYASYIASETDIGAGVATRLALKHPDSVQGITRRKLGYPIAMGWTPPNFW